jgi:hypothetical protein
MGWSWNDVSVDAGAPSANLVDTPMVSAYLFAAQGTQHVIHTSGPGIINELWSGGGGCITTTYRPRRMHPWGLSVKPIRLKLSVLSIWTTWRSMTTTSMNSGGIAPAGILTT